MNSHSDAVQRVAIETGEYLIPAIGRLDGLVDYYAAVAPEGSMVHVSVWRSESDAEQMGSLKEMVVDARRAAEAAGVTFEPIVNHSLVWQIPPGH